MIEELRNRNLQKQVNTIKEQREKSSLYAYDSRDAVTGNRYIVSANGGKLLANYISNTQPNQVFTNVSKNGTSNTINQKPI
jgi:hypothetical protein